MALPIPRPVIAQVVVVIAAVVVFSGVLTIIGSSPTSNVAEHAIGSNVTSAVPDNDITITVAPSPEATESLSIVKTPLPSPSTGSVVAATATATPVPDQHDMISQPDMEVMSLPVNLSGSGTRITSSFRLEPGVTIFDMRHDAPGDFEVRLMRGNDEEYKVLLENGLIADAPMPVDIAEAGAYYLDVTADEDWQINVSQPPDGSV